MRGLKKFDLKGPYQSGKHPYMIRGDLTLTIPNPHSKDISSDLLSKILRQAEISKEKWTSLLQKQKGNAKLCVAP